MPSVLSPYLELVGLAAIVRRAGDTVRIAQNARPTPRLYLRFRPASPATALDPTFTEEEQTSMSARARKAGNVASIFDCML
jgi:hypothetical protein